MRLYIHSFFNAGFWTAFWQYFEWGYKLTDSGIIQSPIWSGTMGSPVLHHGIVGFIVAFVAYLLATYKDYRSFYMIHPVPTKWYQRLIMYLGSD